MQEQQQQEQQTDSALIAQLHELTNTLLNGSRSRSFPAWQDLQSEFLAAAFAMTHLTDELPDFDAESYYVRLLRGIQDKIADHSTAVLEADPIVITVTAGPEWAAGESDKPANVRLTLTL